MLNNMFDAKVSKLKDIFFKNFCFDAIIISAFRIRLIFHMNKFKFLFHGIRFRFNILCGQLVFVSCNSTLLCYPTIDINYHPGKGNNNSLQPSRAKQDCALPLRVLFKKRTENKMKRDLRLNKYLC